ncbi:hypothetical protein MNBD_PLANCTO03-2157 [hydrothermal vent metagenome]|uniref:Lipoprotein n=1 Tax=hydrothermal vent metagenome TaxID=652676 RepID=A0A3B1DVA4_9ZZZZ
MPHVTRLVLVLCWLFFGFGCGPSVWERSFTPEPGIDRAMPVERTVVRAVPWGRIGPALEAERRRLVESETHRTDWTAAQAREAELALLGSLQLPIDPEDAHLLGRSHFKTTRHIDPNSGELADFAARLGAAYAIWSNHPLGKAETIEREAITRDRWRWERVWDADDERFIYVRRWEPETVWVPVVVERDEMRWVVFYVWQD